MARAKVLAGDPATTGRLIYAATNLALSRWVRREAATAAWAGSDIPLNGIAEPIVVARLLAWLNSEENTHLCGQVIYVDGGSDAVLRGDSVW